MGVGPAGLPQHLGRRRSTGETFTQSIIALVAPAKDDGSGHLDQHQVGRLALAVRALPRR
jgi:hypothetical protein